MSRRELTRIAVLSAVVAVAAAASVAVGLLLEYSLGTAAPSPPESVSAQTPAWPGAAGRSDRPFGR